MNTLKLILKKNILDLSYIIKNKFAIFSMIFFLIFSWVMICIFVPIKSASNQIMFVSLYLLLLLGTLSYNWNNSILKDNEIISGINRKIHYSSLLITIFVIGNVFSILMLIGNTILNSLGILLYDWGFLSNPHKFDLCWNQISWFSLLYSINLNILLTFAFYFFIYRLFKNKKSYFSFIMCITIFMIIFGAAFNNYFWCNKYIEQTILGGIKLISYTFDPSKSFFPKNMFLPIAILFPFYSVYQFYGLIFSSPISAHYGYLSISWAPYVPFLINFSDPNHWQWSTVIVMPYIHILLFTILGLSISKKNG